MTEYVAYYRVSTPAQAKGRWQELQAGIVTDYIRAHDGVLVREFAEVASAHKGRRPVFEEAVHTCRETGATLITAYFDRYARNAQMAEKAKQGIKFVCCDKPNMTAEDFSLYAAIAENEADLISQRTKAALAAAKARGVKLGGFRAGQQDRREEWEDRRRENSDKAHKGKADAYAMSVGAFVRQAQHAGKSLQGIADTLTEQGIRTPRGGQWTRASVRNLINRLDALGA